MEVVYAGGVYGQSISGYLSDFDYAQNSSTDLFIGTPNRQGHESDILYTMWFHVSSSRTFYKEPYEISSDNISAFYPVINVKGDVKVLRGTGTSGDPYILKVF